MQSNKGIESAVPGGEIGLHLLVIERSLSDQGMCRTANNTHVGFAESLNLGMVAVQRTVQPRISEGGQRIGSDAGSSALSGNNNG